MTNNSHYCLATTAIKEFWDIIDNSRSEHLWNKENGKWELRHVVE